MDQIGTMHVVAEETRGSRAALIATLTRQVGELMAQGYTERQAIRAVARELEMHAMRVKRLAVLFPEA